MAELPSLLTFELLGSCQAGFVVGHIMRRVFVLVKRDLVLA
jgi:hypothetical protein